MCTTIYILVNFEVTSIFIIFSEAFTWSREIIANLISLYEQHPELYDVRSQEYHNRNLRQIALQEICDDLNRIHLTNLSIPEISKKIHGLRTTFFQEVNKIKKSECSGASLDTIYVPKWWCFDQLQFLKSHGVIYQGSSNISEDEACSAVGIDLQISLLIVFLFS